jgi:AcrR family transcriptional regulator
MALDDLRADDAASPRRARDADETRRDILAAAAAEFSEKGFAGSRVDDIAARTRTSKRMIYYYFGGKDGLYAAVLEQAYGGMRDAEGALRLHELPPADAMRRLVETTFDHHAAHPEFVRLVSGENIEGARTVAASATIRARNAGVVGTVAALLRRGQEEGVFRPGVDPLDLHLLISGFCFYRVSNRHTLGAIFGQDPTAPDRAEAHRRMIVDAVLDYLGAPGAEAPLGSTAGTVRASIGRATRGGARP